MPVLMLRWRRRVARRTNTVARAGNRTRGMDRCARVSISPGSRMRCAMIGATLPLLDALGHLAKPGAVMFPSPTQRDPAPRHRANRAFDPDPRIDMHDDRADEHEAEKRMCEGPEAHHTDGE